MPFEKNSKAFTANQPVVSYCLSAQERVSIMRVVHDQRHSDII
jgi:hypothetical protein